MSLILGAFSTNGTPIDGDEFSRVCSDGQYWNPDYTNSVVERTVALGHLGLCVTEESLTDRQPCLEEGKLFWITADIRLDNRSEIAAKLGKDIKWLRGMSDARLALKAYVKWGEEFVDSLIGDFAIAIWDGERRKLVLVRDHVGAKPLYYSFKKGIFVFGSELRTIVGFSSVSRDIDFRWLTNSLACIYLPDTRESTFYEDVVQLRSATLLVVSSEGVHQRCYWRLNPEVRVNYNSFEDFSEGFRERFDEAVKCRLRSAYPIASEISAGIDSTSILVSALHKCSVGSNIHLFTHGVSPSLELVDDERLKDECHLTEQFLDTLGLPSAERVTGPSDGMDGLFRSAMQQRSAPLMDVWALCSQPLYDKAKKSSARVLLSGAGGNNLVSHPAGRAYYDFARNHEWPRLISELKMEGQRKGKGYGNYMHRFLSNTVYALFPDIYKFRSRIGSVSTLPNFLNKNAIINGAIEDRSIEFASLMDIHDLKKKQVFQATGLYLDRGRLPESSISARSRHLEQRYPMLDIRLMEYCLSAPSEFKRRNGFGRYLLRGSMHELPAFIRWREAYGIGAIPWPGQVLFSSRSSLLSMLEDLEGNAIARELLDLLSLKKTLESLRPSSPHIPAYKRAGVNLALMAAAFFNSDHC